MIVCFLNKSSILNDIVDCPAEPHIEIIKASIINVSSRLLLELQHHRYIENKHSINYTEMLAWFFTTLLHCHAMLKKR